MSEVAHWYSVTSRRPASVMAQKNNACAKITPLLSPIRKVTCAHVGQTCEYGAKAGAKTFENTRVAVEPLGQRI